MKLGKVLELNTVLKDIIDNKDLTIDATCKFRMLGIMKSFEIPVQNFETIKNEKIKEYGTEDEEKGNIYVDANDEEAMGKFQDAMNTLLNEDVDVTVKKFHASDIIDKGLSADYLVRLYDIIEE